MTPFRPDPFTDWPSIVASALLTVGVVATLIHLAGRTCT